MGAISDLRLAMLRGEEAVATTPMDYPERKDILKNFGKHLERRFNDFGNMQNLEQVMHCFKECLGISIALSTIRTLSATYAVSLLGRTPSGDLSLRHWCELSERAVELLLISSRWFLRSDRNHQIN